MARDSRAMAVYFPDNHGLPGDDTGVLMLVPVDDAAIAARGWGVPAGGEPRRPTGLRPRHVQGRDPLTGKTARVVVASNAAELWDGTIASFAVNGVTYNVTGYSGERRTI